jgi:plastocyanin
MGEYAFTGPDTIPAGPVTLRFKLTGVEPHVMAFIRLEQGKRLADVMAAGESVFDSAWAHPTSGGVTISGGESPLYSFSLLPGRYLLLCYFHASDGLPHYAKGMVKEVVVAGPVTAAASLPPATQVEMVDFDYPVSAPLPAGRQTIRVLNPSGQAHEVLIKRLAPETSLEAGRAWIAAGGQVAPSPWLSWGGVSMEPGDTVLMTADFPAGHYRLVCYYRLPGETKNHAERGMDRFIVVNEPVGPLTGDV